MSMTQGKPNSLLVLPSIWTIDAVKLCWGILQLNSGIHTRLSSLDNGCLWAALSKKTFRILLRPWLPTLANSECDTDCAGGQFPMAKLESRQQIISLAEVYFTKRKKYPLPQAWHQTRYTHVVCSSHRAFKKHDSQRLSLPNHFNISNRRLPPLSPSTPARDPKQWRG